MDGLIAYDHTKGFREPVASIEIGEDWGIDVSKIIPLSDVPEWQLAVVLEMGENEARVGLRPDNIADGGVAEDRVEGTLSGP
jgi:penicillin-binding protein 1A